MSTWIIADPHLGHKNISRFRPFVLDSADNTLQFISSWRQTVSKRDYIIMLGDVAFDQESLDVIGNLPGRKVLIKGNHDDLVSTIAHTKVFEEIHGMIKYKGMWLTHCPIHPDEFRGKKGNVHGHVHTKSIMKGKWFWKHKDPRYINACVDVIVPQYKRWFISLDEVKQRLT